MTDRKQAPPLTTYRREAGVIFFSTTTPRETLDFLMYNPQTGAIVVNVENLNKFLAWLPVQP